MPTRPARPLGMFELAQFLTGAAFPFNLVTAVRLAGAVSDADLRAALTRLQSEHPLLRCAVHARDGAPVFELDELPPPIPVRTVERRGSGTWKEEAQAELMRAFETGDAPLMRCVHVSDGRDPERRELLFTFHHVIVDAVAALNVLQRTLDLVVSAGAAAAATTPSTAIPESLDDRLPSARRGLRGGWRNARYLVRQLGDEVGYRWRTRGVRPRVFEGRFRCRILPIVFDARETAALVRATRRHRVSVWSALNAALLLALAPRRYPGRALPHRYFAFPLLRPYLEPPVADDVVGGYFSLLRLSVDVAPDTGLWELAATIHRQSDAAAKRGEKFSSARWSALSMRTLLRQRSCRMGTAALSYAGAVDLRADDTALTVDGLHAFVSNFPLGPEYTAQARIFRGRLWLDILYLDSDMSDAEAAAIAEDLRGLLAGPEDRAQEDRT